MNEDFVSFELAVKLKEKGFKELCLAYYTNYDILYYNYYHKAGACYRDCYLSHNSMPKDSVSGKFVDAPTISQVLKWLRREKNIFIEIFLYDRMYSAFVKSVTQIDENDLFHKCLNEDTSDEEYATYEQSAFAGIKYVLDNLI